MSEQQAKRSVRVERPLSTVGITPSRNRGPAVVVGFASDVPRALEHPVLGESHFSVAGVLTVEDDERLLSQYANELNGLLQRSAARVVMVAGPLGRETMRMVSDIAQVHGCRLLAVMPTDVVAGHDPVVLWEGDAPLVQLAEHRRNSLARSLKRAADVLVSLAALLVLSPALAIIAVAIRLDSRGPVLFRHWRVGRGGDGFHCLKFRTMSEDAESRLATDAGLATEYRANGFRIPDDRDPRVTGLGRWLRRTSLDELPQLFNVLFGEMSLVGPRPVVPEELTHFAGSERLLLSVRPGMTGLWAVSGRHRVAYPERADLELGYVRRWSLASDFRILAGTARAVAEYGAAQD